MNERHANRKAKQFRNDDNVVRLATKPHQDKSLYQSFTRWTPLTEKQALTSQLYDEKPQSIIVQAGSAGTGKTACKHNAFTEYPIEVFRFKKKGGYKYSKIEKPA